MKLPGERDFRAFSINEMHAALAPLKESVGECQKEQKAGQKQFSACVDEVFTKVTTGEIELNDAPGALNNCLFDKGFRACKSVAQCEE